MKGSVMSCKVRDEIWYNLERDPDELPTFVGFLRGGELLMLLIL